MSDLVHSFGLQEMEKNLDKRTNIEPIDFHISKGSTNLTSRARAEHVPKSRRECRSLGITGESCIAKSSSQTKKYFLAAILTCLDGD